MALQDRGAVPNSTSKAWRDWRRSAPWWLITGCVWARIGGPRRGRLGGGGALLDSPPPPRLPSTPGFNRPVLSVEPSPLAQRGSYVALQCSAPVQAVRFRMQKVGIQSSQVEQGPNSVFLWNQASFFIDYISEASAGPYTCRYLYKASWSRPSLPEELVVTGLYPRPAFWAQPGQVVAQGGSADLLCQSHLGLPHFAVVKERRVFLRMNSSGSLISFRIQAMTKNHVGTYYCYGYSPLSPFLWSHPSKALMLEMTDAAISPAIFFSLAQLSLAGLSLLFFGRLGTKTLVRWWSRRKPPGPGEARV
ncbi:platelet glycoprotein VI-like [Sminthopsis crassicaudata]|uniref:platelet glycoprotein VI-like n=1 Tax=Sminthopsis crassicaudata TaxID=9301 RepID=UPI003D69B5F0